MLINLQTIHRPETVEEAAGLLKRAGVYPIYGLGAYLVRLGSREIQGAVDLSNTVSARFGVTVGIPWIGGCATLETITDCDAQIGAIARTEAPLTLRHALTLGDVLMESRPDSPLLAALYGLDAQIVCADDERFTLDDWLEMSLDAWSRNLILRVELPRYARDPDSRRIAIAMEKVARTPADAPIVAALGFADARQPHMPSYAVVVGIDERPVHYIDGMASRISDYKGSAAYRAEMAKLLTEKAIARAVEQAKADPRA